MRGDHEPQWLVLPLSELRLDERVLVVGPKWQAHFLTGMWFRLG